MNHSTPDLPVHHQLLEFTQTHVHRVSDAIQRFSRVRLFVTLWTIAHQAPLSMEFSRPPPRHAHGDLTSLAPQERLPELPVVPREKTHTCAPTRGLGNPMDRGAWQASVHSVTKSRTRLND